MRISKKILAIALSILMAVSMMPFTVLAATKTVSDATEFETEIANATAGDTIKLSADIDLSSYAPKAMHRINITDLTIDLDGHTITTPGRWGVIFTGTNSTIKNGTMEALDNSDAPGYQYGIYVWGGDDANEMPDPAQKASATLENLTVNYGIHLYNSDVTIKNCNVTGSSAYYAVWADIEGTATIESGNFTTGGAAVVGAAQYQNTYFGHINIEGGNFTVPATKKLVQTGSSCKPANVQISGGTFKNADDTAYTVLAINIADGAAEDANGVVTQEYVAKVGDNYYATFEAALAAISTVTTATHSKAADPTYEYKTYKANGTIKLLADTTSNGVIIDSGSNLTIDFNGKTLDINAKPVGSNGTESAAMQLLKDSDITFKDGTLTSSYTYASTDTEYIQRLIQNYADLTLNNMNVGMRGNFMNQMMMSNCNGDVTITNSTISAPDFTWAGYTAAEAAESLGTRVMGVGSFSTAYPDVNVSVTNSTINGDVNIDITAAGTTAELTLNGSDVNGNIVDENMNGATVTNTNSTVDGIPAGYEWNATTGVLGPIADGFNLTVEDCIHMNLYVNAAAYGADEIVVTYSDPDKQNGGTKTETFDVADLEQDAQGRYAVKILAAPAQIGDDVTVTAGSHTYTTSVEEYCNALIAANQSDALTKLAKAMLEYGAEAANEFSYSTSLDYTRGTYTWLYSNPNSPVFSQSYSNSLYRIDSIAYIATSVPSLRLYFDPSISEETMATEGAKTATVDGNEVDVTVDPNGLVCVDITGINAEDLDKTYTVVVGDNTIQVNALKYADLTTNTSFGNAIFQYNRAAEEVFA